MEAPRRSVLLAAIAIVVAVTVVPITSAWAGAWLQAPGASYLKTSWLHLSADERATCRGGTEDADAFGGTYREHQAYLYGELGLVRRVTLVGSFAWKDARVVEADIPDYGTRSGGDLRAGARVGLLTGSLPVSVETLVSVPTYPRTDLTDGFGDRDQYLPAGTGRVGLETRLQAGVSLHPLPLYANVEAGHRLRGGDYGNQWLVGLEVGMTSDRVFLKSDLRGTIGHDVACGGATAGTLSLNERVWHWAPEVAVRVGRDVWLSGGVALPFAGRNTLEGPQWSLGIAWERAGN